MTFTDGKGVHVVYDGVGLSTWEKSMMCVRRRGLVTLVTILNLAILIIFITLATLQF
jgi:NADPH:quinone reductase-like Zn-dependent oxidoreductase